MNRSRKVKLAPPRLKAADSRHVTPPPKRALPIYSDPRYRDWRRVVIARSDGKCQDPQHDPARPRAVTPLYADHVHELRDGGAPFDPANGMARCASCHKRKTDAARARRLRG